MQLFVNNATSTLANAISAAATSLALKAGDGAKFPAPTNGDFFTLTLIGRDANGFENAWEVVNVTARSVDTLTIVRAQEGTAAAAWGVATPAQARPTAAALTTLQSTANAHIARTDNPHNTTKALVGLGNVDNTSDVNKPVSTAQAAADLASLVSVGMGGVGAAPYMTNLDDATAVAGLYYTNAATTGTFPAAGPANTGFLLHKAYGTAGFQLFQQYALDKLFFRRRATSAWQPWVELVGTTGNAANITGVAAIANGGTGATSALAGLLALGGARQASFAAGPENSVGALTALANRAAPNPTADIGYKSGVRFRLAFNNDVDATAGYSDAIDLSTYADSSAGGISTLLVAKNSHKIQHKYGAAGATVWAIRDIAYTDSNITGNAATATKLATARTINGYAFDGTANIALAKGDVGLGNVDNTSDVNKPVSTAQAAADATALASAKAYADGLVVGLWDDRGNYDASVNTFPTAAAGGSGAAGAVLKGDIWTTSVAGTVGGVPVAVKQTLRALIDAPGQTAANWAIGLANTDLDDSITAGVTGRAPSQNAVAAALALKTTATTLAAGGGAALVGVTPTATLVATAVQAALAELDAKKAKLNGDGTQDFAVKSLNGGPLAGFRNKVINGNMMVNQRGQTAAGGGGFLVDRFASLGLAANFYMALGTDGSVSKAGPNHIAIATSTVKAVLATGDYAMMYQVIEGVNIADLKWGTVDAKPLTVSFRAQASVAGVFCISVRNGASNRSYVVPIAIGTAAATYTATIPGDTSGTWNTDTGSGIQLCLCFASGTLYQSPAPSAWAAGNFIATATQSNGMDTNGRVLNWADVQAEAGSVATPFEFRPFGTELDLCQRYYAKTFPYAVAPSYGAGNTAGALFLSPGAYNAYHGAFWSYPVPMRATPTLAGWNVYAATNGFWSNPSSSYTSPPGLIGPGDKTSFIALNSASPTTPNAGDALYIHLTANAEL